MWKLVKAELSYRNAVINLVFQVLGLAVLFLLIIFLLDGEIRKSEFLELVYSSLVASIIFIVIANQLVMHLMEVMEKRVRLFMIMPLKQRDICFARLSTPAVLQFVFFIAMLATALRYIWNDPFTEGFIEASSVITSISLWILLGVTVLKLSSEKYGQYFLIALAFLLGAVNLAISIELREYPATETMLTDFLISTWDRIWNEDICISIVIVIVIFGLVTGISFIKRKSYLR